MHALREACYAALTACAAVLLLKFLFRPKKGEASLFTPEEDGAAAPCFGGAFCLIGTTIGTLLFLFDGQKAAIAGLLFMAAASLAGLSEDLRRLRTGKGFAPVVLPGIMLVLALAASAALIFMAGAGTLVLPVTGKTFSLGGWAIPLFALVMLLRIRNERTFDAVPGAEPALTLAVSGFWCLFFCIISGTGALSSATRATNAAGLSVFAGAVSGAWLGLSLFNTGETVWRPGKSGYYGAAAAVSAMACGAGYLVLHPLISLWPALSAVYAFFALLLNKKKPGRMPKYLTGLLAKDGVKPEAVFSAALRAAVLGSLIAFVLYFL